MIASPYKRPRYTLLVGLCAVSALALCALLSVVGNSASLLNTFNELHWAPPLAAPACERVLVCVLASTRGHRITWPTWHNLLENLCPGHPENVDLALAVAEEHNTTGNEFYRNAKFVWTYPEQADWGDAFDHVQRLSNCSGDWRSILRIGDQWLGGILGEHQQPGSAAILIFFRWFLLRSLKAQGLLDKYDRFVLTRSDYYYDVLHPPLSVLPREHIWIPDGEGWGGVTDRHIILPRTHVAAAIDLAADIVCSPQQLAASMSHISNWNLEQVIKHRLVSRGLWKATRFYPYVPFTTREQDETSRWFAGTFDDEAGLVIKYRSEYERYKHFKAIIHSNEDWAEYMKSHSEDTLVNRN